MVLLKTYLIKISRAEYGGQEKVLRKKSSFCAYFNKSDKVLMGSATLENIIGRPFYSSNLGYWIGQEYRRLGYMSCAIRCLLEFAEVNWGITKVYAATLQENTASIELLKKN